MKQGKSAQIKNLKHRQQQQKFMNKHKLPEFNYNEFAGFFRARYYLTHRQKYSPETFEVASFFLDDVIAMMVNHNFTSFTSNERAVVKLNEVMQAALVNSDDRDWRYFVMLVPVLYDMQQFLVKEGSVNERFVAQAPKFDINFWRMIMRTVMAINFFKWQGKDVAELMKTSSAIDDLQFKFLQVDDKDDHFNLPVIAETFRGLSPKMKPLKGADSVVALEPKLTEAQIQAELEFADKRLAQFKAASVKDVVSDNVVNMLRGFHEGLATEYQATHDLWQPAMFNALATDKLFNYWSPDWDNLDGIGGEVKSYLTFLSQKQDISGLSQFVTGTAGIDRYIDVAALNHLLGQMPEDVLAERAL